MHELNSICQKRLSLSSSEFPLLYLCRKCRKIIPRLTAAIVTFLCIGGVAWTQTTDIPVQQQQSEQQRSEIPFPQTRPLGIPRITNVTPAQERLEQEKGLEKNLLQPVAPLPPEPDLEFQEFVASSLGAKLPIFGQ